MTDGPSIITAPRTWHTKLCAWGTSQGIRIPKEVCAELGITLGDQLDVAVSRDSGGASMLIKTADTGHRRFTAVPRISLPTLFASYQGDYSGEELDWGPDIGAEAIR